MNEMLIQLSSIQAQYILMKGTLIAIANADRDDFQGINFVLRVQ
jgi:hypothetical protein